MQSYPLIKRNFSNREFYPAAIRLLLFLSGLVLVLGSHYGVVDMLEYFRDDDVFYGMLYLFLLILLFIFSLYMLIGSIVLPLRSIENWMSRFIR